MHHPSHSEVKRLKQQLAAAHHEALMSLHETLGLLKASVNEAHVFVTAGNMQQAAESLTQLYYDCDNTQRRIAAIAEKQ